MEKLKQSFELIGEQYLDTQHDQEYFDQIDEKLKSLGTTGFKRIFYVIISEFLMFG